MNAFTRTVLLGAVMAMPMIGQAGAAPAAAKPVTVTNTVATTDDANPFSVALNVVLSSGTGNQTFTVPSGYRLVIDYVSARAVLYTVGAAVSFSIGTTAEGASFQAFPPMELVGTIDGSTVYALGSPARIFADAGSTVSVALLSASPTGGATVGITGHLVVVPN